MKSGHRTLHWDDPEPGHVHRRHEDPTTSDNFGMIRRLSEKAVGPDLIKAGDFNMQAAWSTRRRRWVAYGGHWKDPKRNGYTRVKRRLRRGTRPMNKRERAREDWTWEQLRRLRRPNGERPRSDDELLTYAVEHHTVMIRELKSPHFRSIALLRDMIGASRRHDHPAWFMVLDDMEPRGKVAAVRQAAQLEGGGQIALIFGTDGVQKPARWSEWDYYPNEIWGPVFAKRWLPAA